MKFWDTSALLPLCVNEPQSEQVQNVINQDGDLVVWWATLIEGFSAFARLRREEAFTGQEEFQARQVLTRLGNQWTENDLSPKLA
jgi:uncharacterized protein